MLRGTLPWEPLWLSGQREEIDMDSLKGPWFNPSPGTKACFCSMKAISKKCTTFILKEEHVLDQHLCRKTIEQYTSGVKEGKQQS
jgi:hypothetical protein